MSTRVRQNEIVCLTTTRVPCDGVLALVGRGYFFCRRKKGRVGGVKKPLVRLVCLSGPATARSRSRQRSPSRAVRRTRVVFFTRSVLRWSSPMFRDVCYFAFIFVRQPSLPVASPGRYCFVALNAPSSMPRPTALQ